MTRAITHECRQVAAARQSVSPPAPCLASTNRSEDRQLTLGPRPKADPSWSPGFLLHFPALVMLGACPTRDLRRLLQIKSPAFRIPKEKSRTRVSLLENNPLQSPNSYPVAKAPADQPRSGRNRQL